MVLKQVVVELIVYLLEFLKIYLLFSVLGIDVPPIVIAVVTVLSQVVSFLLFSPGGLGVVEGSAVGLYYLFGINVEIAAAVTIINRMIIYAYGFLGGYISFLYVKKKY